MREYSTYARSPYETALSFYEIFMTKHNSYQTLITILETTRQTGALHILLQGDVNLSSNDVLHVAIEFPLEVFVDIRNHLSEIVKENRDYNINTKLHQLWQQLLDTGTAKKSITQNPSRLGPSLVPSSDSDHAVYESSYPRSRALTLTSLTIEKLRQFPKKEDRYTQLPIESAEKGELPKKLQEVFYEGRQLVVNVRQPKETVEQAQLKNSKYLLPPKGKAYAFIGTMIKFERQSYRLGAHLDTTNMTNLMKGLGFKIFPEDEDFRKDVFKTKATIQKELKHFYEKCKTDEVDCFLVFFSSHGYNDIILTSDEQPLHFYTDIIYKFETPSESKKIAKIFINNSCQIDPPPYFLHPNPYCGGAEEVIVPDVKDAIYLKAQLPRSLSNRDTKCGSYLVIVLTYVFMEKAHNTSLLDMLHEVQQHLTKISKEADKDACQICQYIPIRLESPFYFFTK
ncbi:unnamed protein product [Orchesella dallaii]|uniref:Caspase-8 n=1 Tax=Orchesella dallaii TaxID=48710 RepID=A0ABP1RHG1_9HEXA